MIQKLLSFGTWLFSSLWSNIWARHDCGVRYCEKCLYARYDPRICFRCNGQYAHQPPDRRRETKRSDADCLQNDRTRADRHSAGTLMLFVYPSYGAVYLHRRFGLSRCLYSAGYLLCFDRYELRIPLFEAVSGTGNTTNALILESVVLIAYTFSVWFFASYISTRVEWVWTSEFTYGTLIGLVSWLFMRFASWQRKKSEHVEI